MDNPTPDRGGAETLGSTDQRLDDSRAAGGGAKDGLAAWHRLTTWAEWPEAIMRERDCGRAEAEVILDRFAARLHGYTREEAAELHPLGGEDRRG